MAVIRRFIRMLKYRSLKKKDVFIEPGAVVEKCNFEGHNAVSAGSCLIGCNIGKGSYVKENCLLKNVSIGRFTSIAPRVRLVYGEHLLKNNVSLHPSLYKGRSIANLHYMDEKKIDEYRFASSFYCEIGSDVWVCADSIIREGVRIGNGAVIAAGSVVVKDVPSFAIVGGNPAKIIRFRFNEEQISFLERIRWWDKNDSWIINHADLFDNVDVLRNYLENKV